MAGLTSQLVVAALATPRDLRTALACVGSLAAVLRAPPWVVAALRKIAPVGEGVGRLVDAILAADVRGALGVIAEIAGELAGGDGEATARALTKLLDGDFGGAVAIPGPHLAELPGPDHVLSASWLQTECVRIVC